MWGATSAVADVKYKLVQDEWRRSDLYEVVAFATGFRTTCAALLEFAPPERGLLPTLRVGDIGFRLVREPAAQSR